MTPEDRDALIERVSRRLKLRASVTPSVSTVRLSLEDVAALISLASPSPAQWPEDVVERAIQAWVGPEYRAKPKREHYAKMRAVLDSAADAIFSKTAALATLPPPEDERVKGLETENRRLQARIDDYVAQEDGRKSRSALASYRGGA